jgi:hypothetical protein
LKARILAVLAALLVTGSLGVGYESGIHLPPSTNTIISLPSSVPPCTDIANSATITPIPCGQLSSTFAFVVDRINLTAPTASDGNGTLALTLVFRGFDFQYTTLLVAINASIIVEYSASLMHNGSHIIQVPSILLTSQGTAHLTAGERYQVVLEAVTSTGEPPPEGEPAYDTVYVYLRAT